jgi:hypothetical protein
LKIQNIQNIQNIQHPKGLEYLEEVSASAAIFLSLDANLTHSMMMMHTALHNDYSEYLTFERYSIFGIILHPFFQLIMMMHREHLKYSTPYAAACSTVSQVWFQELMRIFQQLTVNE